MLSDRRQRVLAALIEEYVSRAVPVGSRTLVEQYHLGVSPATVRNELSVLEDDGYIEQPHTSSGRVPTDYGYRSFVDDLLDAKPLSDEQDGDVEGAVDDLRQSAARLDDLMEQTSQQLSRLTECLSVVVPPSSLGLNVKQISFVLLTPYRVLIVVVSDDGQVLNRQVDFASEVDSDELARAQELVSRVLVGKSLQEIRGVMDLKTVEALRAPLVQALIGELFDCLKQGGANRSHHLGLPALLKQPEFVNSQALVPVLHLLEDDTVLLELLDDEASDDDIPLVRIGHENGNEQLAGVSVVAGRFGRGDAAGVVAVIGPTRMDYPQVIKAVHTAQQNLRER